MSIRREHFSSALAAVIRIRATIRASCQRPARFSFAALSAEGTAADEEPCIDGAWATAGSAVATRSRGKESLTRERITHSSGRGVMQEKMARAAGWFERS
jgi:hypothetical protein